MLTASLNRQVKGISHDVPPAHLWREVYALSIAQARPFTSRNQKWTPEIGQADKCIPGSGRQPGSGFVVHVVWRTPVK